MTDVALIPNRNQTGFLHIEYRPGTPDEAVLREVFIGDGYHLDHIGDDLNGGVVIDVGAHIGCVTLACLDRGARKVIAVEPNVANHALLCANVRRNFPDGRVIDVASAVGDPTRAARVVVRGESAVAYTEPADGADVLVVDFATALAWADLADDERVALLKVDVEGAEYDWFATATTDQLARIGRIAMEWHGHGAAQHLDDIATRYGQLVASLAETHSVSMFGRLGDGGMLYAHRND